jgi:hypothetical protein
MEVSVSVHQPRKNELAPGVYAIIDLGVLLSTQGLDLAFFNQDACSKNTSFENDSSVLDSEASQASQAWMATHK